ncbi:MAG: M28 family peptidase [Chloroflexi bacterium]|nr:M28 family peptidase [Chloroflexota bacterium]
MATLTFLRPPTSPARGGAVRALRSRLLPFAIALLLLAAVVAGCREEDAPPAPPDAAAQSQAAAVEIEEEEAADQADQAEPAPQPELAGADPETAGAPEQSDAPDPADDDADDDADETEEQAPAPIVAPAPYDNDNALRVLEALSVTIGERILGSQAERDAAAFLAAEFESYGYDVELQPVPLESRLIAELRLVADGDVIDAQALGGSGPGDVEGPLVVVPGMGTAEDFAQVDAAGAVVLIERGEIFFRDKVANAAAAGAVGAIIFNNEAGPFSGTLGEESAIPALAVSLGSGIGLRARTARGPVTAAIVLRYDPLSGESQNVLARHPEGACRVWVGGHYDTVLGVGGANDNGSGTALVVELARAYAGATAGRLLCFAAFGAEEAVVGSPGIVGSRVLVESLTESGEIAGVTAMLNLDVAGVGSPVLLVGDAPLIALAEEVAAELGIDVSAGGLPPGFGSDHLNFAQVGVPVIFPTLPNGPIHVPEDQFEVVEPEALEAVGRLAHGLLGCLAASADAALAETCVVGLPEEGE